MPSLSVVIVNYRSWSDTATLVRQLWGAGRAEAEIVVVDNHSPPHRLLARLRRWEGVSLRRWGRNRGFGRAVNEGVRLSRGRWLLLLNPDTSVSAGFLDHVLSLIESAPDRVGIIGFRLLDSDETPQPSVGRFPTFAGTLAGLPRPRARRKYLHPQPRQRCEVDWLSGCCLLIRKECFAELGGFDPAFFLYYEDVDLCLRARQRGWSVCFEPGLSLRHHRPLHSRIVPPHVRLFIRHALLTYADKHWPTWQTRALAALVRIEAGLRRLGAWCRGRRRAVRVFAEMGALAAELGRGHREAAWKRLCRVARQEESRAARAVRRHPQPQSTGLAPRVPDERLPVRPAEHADHRG